MSEDTLTIVTLIGLFVFGVFGIVGMIRAYKKDRVCIDLVDNTGIVVTALAFSLKIIFDSISLLVLTVVIGAIAREYMYYIATERNRNRSAGASIKYTKK